MRPLSPLLIAVLFAWAAGAAHAVTLDWSTASWTAGTLSNTYDVDPAHAGSDLTIAITGDTTQFTAGSPSINTNLQGGFATAPSALNLFVDFTSQAQSVTISVNFSSGYALGVSGVSFTLFDVDNVNSGATGFQDKISSIIGIAPDGSQVAATITLTANTVDTVTNPGTTAAYVLGTANSNNTTAQGPNTDAGNVTISFAGPITSFSFVYGSGTNANADPTQQQISMYNLTFTPIPEINPAWFGALSCIVAGLIIRRHNARFRK